LAINSYTKPLSAVMPSIIYLLLCTPY